MRFLKKLLAIRRANKILAAEKRERKRFSFTCRMCRQEFDTREVTPILLSYLLPEIGNVCSRRCNAHYWSGGME